MCRGDTLAHTPYGDHGPGRAFESLLPIPSDPTCFQISLQLVNEYRLYSPRDCYCPMHDIHVLTVNYPYRRVDPFADLCRNHAVSTQLYGSYRRWKRGPPNMSVGYPPPLFLILRKEKNRGE